MQNTLKDRILDRIKVTAILPDELVQQVQKYSGGKNITESLSLALNEWLRLAKLRRLNRRVRKNSLQFQPGFTARKIRAFNREVT